jgi:hypothetical protein
MNAYPRLSPADVREFVLTLSQDEIDETLVKTFLESKGIDVRDNHDAVLDRLVVELVAACGDLNDKDLEAVEARYAGPVHLILDAYPDEQLGDSQFWSFLAVRYFWPFIRRRQSAAWLKVTGRAGKEETPESENQKLERYVVGKDHYQIPLRMYLRAQSVRDGNDFSLTYAQGAGTDFWRSQILGVRTAAYPPLARAVATVQAELQLGVEEHRPSGRRLNRLRANVEFCCYDSGEADLVVRGLWLLTDADRDEIRQKKTDKASRSKRKTQSSQALATSDPEDRSGIAFAPDDPMKVRGLEPTGNASHAGAGREASIHRSSASPAGSQSPPVKFLELDVDEAVRQWTKILGRSVAENSDIRRAFLPTEIVLCAGLLQHIGYFRAAALDEKKMLKFVPVLAKVLRRSESSVAKKLQTLNARTGSRKSTEQEFMQFVESDPAQLEKFIEISVQGARLAGLSSRQAAKIRFS